MSKFPYADKYVRLTEDIPSTEHWAIIVRISITIPGDERSRTNPGHGYPERTENYIEYRVYLTEEKFKTALEHEFSSTYPGDICGIHVLAKYGKKVTIEAIKQ